MTLGNESDNPSDASPTYPLGARIPRTDGPEKAAGEARFGADEGLPGMLTGRLLLSPHPHALIRRIDTRRARALPGVHAVVTDEDTPQVRLGRFVEDETLFARGRVRFRGERVAAVAAVDGDVAEEALSLIRVEYEPLPAVFDMDAALAEGAPIIHPDLGSYKSFRGNIRSGNMPCLIRINSGDAEAALGRADHVFEDTYETQLMHAGYLEPRACLADPSGGGNYTVWTPSQAVFAVRSFIAEALGISLSRLRVICTHVGGGFGGKTTQLLEVVTVLLASKADRPVQIVLDREEDTLTSHPRHPFRFRLETGVSSEGKLLARRAEIIGDTGAFATSGPNVLGRTTYSISGPYRMEHVSIEAKLAYTNNLPSGSVRGLGAPQAAYACEVQVDRIARELGIDPIEFRLRNAFREGDSDSVGARMYAVSLEDTLRRAAGALDWAGRKKESGEGYGVACSRFPTGGGPSGATLRANEDGTLIVAVGGSDLGTGLNTIAAQLVAAEMGVDLSRVSVISADTASTPYDRITGGSRTTYNAGQAIRLAADDMKAQLIREAAEAMEVAPVDLEYSGGGVRAQADPGRRLSLKELVARAYSAGEGPPIGSGSFRGLNPPHDASTVEGHPEPARSAPQFATQIAHVRVDPDTGEVDVLRFINAQDVGFAFNPLQLEGQMEGGVVQGLGYALSEELAAKSGTIEAPGLEHMLMPTAMDIGAVESLIVEKNAADGPYGAKGAGETPIVPTAAAVANAIADATGAYVAELPVTPERVLRAMREKTTREKKGS
jgi:carbon-monoxide dehydrogenase large subunit